MKCKINVIKIGQIVKVFDDEGEYRLARVISLNYNHETAVVCYLDEMFFDQEIGTVLLMNLKKYEGRPIN